MICIYAPLPQVNNSIGQTFKRRQVLPCSEGSLWQLKTGAVRVFTWAEDGTIVTLGFWGAGAIIGQALARIQPYQVQCLSQVSARYLEVGQLWRNESDRSLHFDRVMLAHLHQTQELLRIRSGPIPERLEQLLLWLASQFGRYTKRGQSIGLRLTHQEIAETIGTTRVTVTRLLHQFQREGLVSLSRQEGIVLR
ncbi:MAG: Crp/Fnr family transcriptional regulator [Cyanobacteriota bacterium]|nr:Crp/Fnr family transcriptional regulator [Cyanobacteriota bacterium]